MPPQVTAVLAWFGELDSSIWAALIGVFGALLGGVIGGWMTRSATLEGARLANEANAAHEAAAIRRRVFGAVEMVLSEIREIQTSYLLFAGASGGLHGVAAGFSRTFTAYESAAPMLGLLEDEDFRHRIVCFYGRAAVLFDVIRRASDAIEALDVTERRLASLGTNASAADRDFAEAEREAVERLKLQVDETASLFRQNGQLVDESARKWLSENDVSADHRYRGLAARGGVPPSVSS